jgi:hypothetical protein
MESDRIATELKDPTAQELLNCAVGHLAYNGTDGVPRVIPIGFYWNGKGIVVCTATTSPKVHALEAHPEVAFTVDVLGPPAKVLSVRGVTSTEIVPGIPPEYIKASAKGMDESRLADFEAQVRSVYPEMARITIVPTWARVFDFGAGRVPEFLATLVDEAGR